MTSSLTPLAPDTRHSTATRHPSGAPDTPDPSHTLTICARLPPSTATEHPRLDVSLCLPPGVTALTGPSGAGKSTLLAVIAGLIRPAEGRVTLRGRTLLDTRTKTFTPPHRRRVALVFQSLALFPHLRAWENVAYGLPAGTPSKQRKPLALSWLDRFSAAHLADRAPPTLSGGEAQRVALARALASSPFALLLDEPFSALDAPLRQHLIQTLRDLIAQDPIPVLLVTHHPADAAALGAPILYMREGCLVTST
jgi:molybdate transport system ATP-binding protein